MNYTKGEWKLRWTAKTNDIEAQIGKNVKALVASIWFGYRYRVTHEEALANAHLIAAAPLQNETLNAVRSTLVEILGRHTKSGFHNNRVSSDCQDAIKLIDVALAKAEGKNKEGVC